MHRLLGAVLLAVFGGGLGSAWVFVGTDEEVDGGGCLARLVHLCDVV
jgi:hypothetical protein